MRKHFIGIIALFSIVCIAPNRVSAINYWSNGGGPNAKLESNGSDCYAGQICISNLSKTAQRPNPCFYTNPSVSVPQCYVEAWGGTASTPVWGAGGDTQYDCFTSACNARVFFDSKSIRNRDAVKRTLCVDQSFTIVGFPYATTGWEVPNSASGEIWNTGLIPNSANWRCV